MPAHTFTATIVGFDHPGAWDVVNVPFDTRKTFGTQSSIPVAGTVNGAPFRSSLMARGDGGHYLVVNKEMQKAAGAGVGDAVIVTIEPGAAPRTLEIPPDLAAALTTDPEAATAFARLAYSHRKAYLDWVHSAKKDDTRRSRIARTLTMVKQGLRLKG